MPSISRIRFNPVTREIEIEGSEQFVTSSFDKILKMISGVPERTVKEPSLRKPRQAKRARKSGKPKTGRGSITDTVLAVIKQSPDGITTAELMKKTGFTQKQIWPVIKKAEKTGKIKRPRRGVYITA
jgi:predicted Rossmann fold nucleotide-binding protein DprA/Smf involved in DNA uptake